MLLRQLVPVVVDLARPARLSVPVTTTGSYVTMATIGCGAATLHCAGIE